MDKSDQAMMGARAALLTGREIQRLIMAAKRAHDAQVACGLADEEFGVWRHAALWEAVGKQSFRAVTQHELGGALKYFRELAGDEDNERTVWQRKNATIVKHEESGESDRRRALYKLRLRCVELAEVFGSVEGAEAYACAILRRTHKLPAGEEWRSARAKQLLQTMFTLNTRARAKVKKQKLEDANANG